MGCNVIKGGLPLDNAKALIAALVSGEADVDDDGLLNPAKPESCPVTSADAKYIRAWSRRQLAELEKPHRKVNWLSLQDIEGLVKAVYVGQGRVQDVSGAVLPLVCFGLDRVDTTQGYEPGNVRLLENGENRLKNSDPSDRRVVQWRTGARIAIQGDHAKLPGADHWAQFQAAEEEEREMQDWWQTDEEGDDRGAITVRLSPRQSPRRKPSPRRRPRTNSKGQVVQRLALHRSALLASVACSLATNVSCGSFHAQSEFASPVSRASFVTNSHDASNARHVIVR